MWLLAKMASFGKIRFSFFANCASGHSSRYVSPIGGTQMGRVITGEMPGGGSAAGSPGQHGHPTIVIKYTEPATIVKAAFLHPVPNRLCW